MNYKPNILIVGPSGSGKSSSLRLLPPESTAIIDREKKGMPYKITAAHRILTGDSNADYKKLREECLKDPSIEVVVDESFTKYAENLLQHCRLAYKGYDIYSNYNSAIRQFLDSCKSTEKIMVLTGIDELVELAGADGSKRNVQRLKVSGKEWEGCIEKEFLIVLFTDVRKINDKIVYRFLTNTDGLCSAKSPMGMFAEQYIPNDLNLVVQRIKEFYK